MSNLIQNYNRDVLDNMKTNILALADLLYSKELINNDYLPVIEAIANSLQSCSLLQETKPNLQAKVVVIFSSEQGRLNVKGIQETTYSQVIVQDNGLGFTEECFRSFENIADTNKSEIGCKGLGRLSWLLAFEKVNVTSTYEKESGFFTRQFDFLRQGDSFEITNHNNESIGGELSTEVRFINPTGLISYETRKIVKSFQNKLEETFLPYFLKNQQAEISVQCFDTSENDFTISYQDMEIEEIGSFQIQNQDFRVYCHFSDVQTKGKSHFIAFTGNERLVTKENLDDLLGKEKLQKDNEDSSYYMQFYVESDYLNKHVNTARNAFDIPQKKPALLEEGESIISYNEILEKAKHQAEMYCQSHLNESESKKKACIDQAILEYPFLEEYIKNEDIKYTDNHDTIVKKGLNAMTESGQNLKATVLKNLKSESDVDQKALQENLKKITHHNSMCLAYYMGYRKTILDVLERYQSFQSNQKHCPEKVVHTLICPMGTTSKDLDIDEHNLWVIDDRLAHQSLRFQSDKALTAFDIDSKREVDILWKTPFILSDSLKANILNSVGIVEFKRPDRNLNIQDVKEAIELYVRPLRKNEYKVEGRAYKADDSIVTLYSIITFKENLTDYLLSDSYLPHTSGMDCLFRYYDNERLKLMHYVISWDRFIENSKMRHTRFFDKLFPPKT